MDLLSAIEKLGPDALRDESEIQSLLEIDVTGEDFYRLLSLSNRLSRQGFGDRGYVFAQIGLNAEPCSKNCAFCSMGSTHYAMDAQWRKEASIVRQEVEFLVGQGIDALFLMTTADYPPEMFLEMAGMVRTLLPETVKLVANIGDFSEPRALELKAAGCTGVYHICRLREGRDTEIPPESREATLAAALKVGLEIYYCIEPVGPEHDYSELTREIMRSRTLDVKYMAAMRRVPVPGTPLADKGQISALELAKIVAVVNLAVRPSVSMNVHEPMQMPLLAGVNQLYAESGANPRDTQSQTELGRGFSPDAAWRLLAEGGWRRPG